MLLANYRVSDCSLILPRISGLHVEHTSEPPSQRGKEAEVYLHPDVAEGFFLGAGGLLTKSCLTLATLCSSLTRDQTQAPFIGSSECQPLDHQGSP